METVKRIVVGADGSESATHALDWAAAEAATHDAKLRIVHAVVWSMVDTPLDYASYGIPREDLRIAAESILAEAKQRVEAAAPGVAAETYMEVGGPAQVLLGVGEDADMIVVGNRGHGGFTGLLVGSTAVQVSAHADCPVAVVRPEGSLPDARGPVVVGVDGSEQGRLALHWAVGEGAARQCAVRAVYAVPPDDSDEHAAEIATAGERLLDEAMAAAGDGVKLSTELVRESPAEALVSASRTASVVAVGGRGRGGFRGLLFGSVSHALIHHAASPVVVVRGNGRS